MACNHRTVLEQISIIAAISYGNRNGGVGKNDITGITDDDDDMIVPTRRDDDTLMISLVNAAINSGLCFHRDHIRDA